LTSEILQRADGFLKSMVGSRKFEYFSFGGNHHSELDESITQFKHRLALIETEILEKRLAWAKIQLKIYKNRSTIFWNIKTLFHSPVVCLYVTRIHFMWYTVIPITNKVLSRTIKSKAILSMACTKTGSAGF
jgi:hypothetical protein